MKRAHLAVAVAVAALATFTSVEASPWEPSSTPARQLLDEGRAAYKAGDHAAAAALFLKSAEAEDSQNARWNAAQALASAGEWRRALALFDQLANDKTLPKDRRATVQGRQRIAAVFVAAEYAAEAGRWDEASESLRKLIAETADLDRVNATRALESVTQRRAEADARARADREAAERSPPLGRNEAGQATGAAPTAQQIDRPSRLSDTVALSLVGVGVVGVGVGVGFWWHGNKLAADSDSATDEAEIADLRDRADTQRTIGRIALGAGTAVLIAGAIKLAIAPDARRSTVAAVQPTSGGAMLVLGGDF